MKADDIYFMNRLRAITLVREGMRIPLVHAMTGVAWRYLHKIWLDSYGETASLPGRLPVNTISYIKYRQSPLMLSTLVSVYLAVEKRAKTQAASHAEMFIHAWESRYLFAEGGNSIDINAAWYAIRDVKSGLVSWVSCKQCKATYIFDTELRETSNCPYCGEQDMKFIGPGKQ